MVRLRHRGVRLDLDAHAELMQSYAARRLEAADAYRAACLDMGRPELAASLPETPADKRALLETMLSSEELRCWQRTAKSGELSTARGELRKRGALSADLGAGGLVAHRQDALRLRPDAGGRWCRR